MTESSTRRYFDDPNRTKHMHRIEDELRAAGRGEDWDAWLDLYDQIDRQAIGWSDARLSDVSVFDQGCVGVVQRIIVDHYPYATGPFVLCHECPSAGWPCQNVDLVVEYVMPLEFSTEWLNRYSDD